MAHIIASGANIGRATGLTAGTSADDTITAAQAVALAEQCAERPTYFHRLFTKLPNKRAPDDAPRWARTDQAMPLWDYSSAEQLQSDGTAPLNVYFRIPPDLYYGTDWASDRPNAILHLNYRYNSIAIGPLLHFPMRFRVSRPLGPRCLLSCSWQFR